MNNNRINPGYFILLYSYLFLSVAEFCQIFLLWCTMHTCSASRQPWETKGLVIFDSSSKAMELLAQNCMAKFFVTVMEIIVIVGLSSFATPFIFF